MVSSNRDILTFPSDIHPTSPLLLSHTSKTETPSSQTNLKDLASMRNHLEEAISPVKNQRCRKMKKEPKTGAGKPTSKTRNGRTRLHVGGRERERVICSENFLQIQNPFLQRTFSMPWLIQGKEEKRMMIKYYI